MIKKVELIDVEEKHLTDEYVSWLNDPKVTRFLEVRHEVHTLESIKSYYEQIRGNSANIWKAIVCKRTMRHIGNIKCSMNRYKVGELSLFIGNKDYWGQGIGTCAIEEIMNLAYKLGAEKLIAFVYSSNNASIRAFSRCGFEVEAILRREVVDRGERIDVVRLYHKI